MSDWGKLAEASGLLAHAARILKDEDFDHETQRQILAAKLTVDSEAIRLRNESAARVDKLFSDQAASNRARAELGID